MSAKYKDNAHIYVYIQRKKVQSEMREIKLGIDNYIPCLGSSLSCMEDFCAGLPSLWLQSLKNFNFETMKVLLYTYINKIMKLLQGSHSKKEIITR